MWSGIAVAGGGAGSAICSVHSSRFTSSLRSLGWGGPRHHAVQVDGSWLANQAAHVRQCNVGVLIAACASESIFKFSILGCSCAGIAKPSLMTCTHGLARVFAVATAVAAVVPEGATAAVRGDVLVVAVRLRFLAEPSRSCGPLRFGAATASPAQRIPLHCHGHV